MINKVKIGTTITYVGILYFLVYNTAFGWNYTAQSPAEVVCDEIFKWVMKLALLFFFWPFVDWYYVWTEQFYSKNNQSKPNNHEGI